MRALFFFTEVDSATGGGLNGPYNPSRRVKKTSELAAFWGAKQR